MRTGRQTSDKKDNVIKVRTGDEIKNYLESESRRTGKSVSEIIRCCIRKCM